MFENVRYLLLQVRDCDDPMRGQEVECFARALKCGTPQIQTLDLLAGIPKRQELDDVEIVLIGGSGSYSVVEGGPWLPPALEAMRMLHELAKPTFASCWGFQAMAKALGGAVVTDLSRAEVGTHDIRLTEAGRDDPVFSLNGDSFHAQMGHQDIVDEIPIGATLLASTDRVKNQAFCFPKQMIYCTQFHPELSRTNLLERVAAYPEYIERIAGIPPDEFVRTCKESPQAEALLPRFVEHVMRRQ